MSAIRTWEELLASDLPLRGNEVDYSTVGNHFAIIHNHQDGLLRLDWGVVIESVIHQVHDPLAKDPEPMLVVLEAQLNPQHGDLYVPVRGIFPHYRTANNLGLVGNHADISAYSVLVATDKLHMIGFTDTPEPLKQYEKELLSGA